MKFFVIRNPQKYGEFAQFSVKGTWTEGKICPECQFPTSQLISPIKVEWGLDSQIIGSFSWGFGSWTTAIKPEVVNFFVMNGYVVLIEDVLVVAPKKVIKKNKQISYPYTGPELKSAKPSKAIPINLVKSEIKQRSNCQECKNQHFSFRTNNLFIDRQSWNGEINFSIMQFPSSVHFVTQDGLDLLLKQNFTNWEYEEAGQIE